MRLNFIRIGAQKCAGALASFLRFAFRVVRGVAGDRFVQELKAMPLIRNLRSAGKQICGMLFLL